MTTARDPAARLRELDSNIKYRELNAQNRTRHLKKVAESSTQHWIEWLTAQLRSGYEIRYRSISAKFRRT